MADLSGKEYWLYKEIEEGFRQLADPGLFFNQVKEILDRNDVYKYEHFLKKIPVSSCR